MLVYKCTCTHVHYMYEYTHKTRTHTHTHTHIHTNTCTCTHTHIHRTHTHAHTHTNVQTCTHTHTGTNTWTKHSTTGPAPKAMSMSGVLCDGKIVTFGGVLSGKGCNSIHMLDIGNYAHSLYTFMYVDIARSCMHVVCLLVHVSFAYIIPPRISGME